MAASSALAVAPPPDEPPPDEPLLPRRGWLRHVAGLAHHRHCRVALGAVAFADSSFLPVPPDLLLVPMVLFRREKLRLLLAICTIASSLGAVLGYLIGYQLWGLVGAPLVEFYGYTDKFYAFQHLVAVWGVWIILAKAFTPIPFKVAAIAAGVAAMDPIAFMLATVIGRGLHFAMVGALLAVCGERLLVLIARYERRLAILSLLAVIVLALAWFLR
ncbi:MAG: YqaA family protein [Thiohalocapsa sp.]